MTAIVRGSTTHGRRSLLYTGHLHGNDIALLWGKGHTGMLDQRLPTIVAGNLRNVIACILGSDKSLVGQHGIVDDALADTQLRDLNLVWLDGLHDRHRDIGLILYGGHDVILVLNLSLHDIPADADSLIAQVDGLIGGGSRIDGNVVLVGVVLVGSDVQLVVAFGQLNAVETVSPALSLSDEGTRNGIAQHHLSVGNVRLLFSIIGELVGHVDRQRALLVADRRDGEVDIGTVTILAVDTHTTRDGHVQLHIAGRHQTQYHVSGVVLVQASHCHTRQCLHPVG